VVGGLFYKFGKSGTVTPFTKAQTIKMTIFNEDVPNFISDNVKVGDLVRDRVQNVVIGKVTEIKLGPDINYNPNDKGEEVVSSKPGYSSVTVVIDGSGLYNANGATFGGVEYFINKNVEWRVGITDFYAKITSLAKE
jgi:hypothetical protein